MANKIQNTVKKVRKVMPAAVFVDIWRRFYYQESEWGEVVKKRRDISGDPLLILVGVEVTGDIVINGERTHDIVLSNCKLSNCTFKGNGRIRSIKITESSTIEGIYVRNSQAEDINIENSTVGVFKLENSSIGNCVMENSVCHGGIWVEKKSVTGDIVIENSVMGDFNVKSSRIGNVRIRNKSTVGDLQVIEYANAGRITLSSGSVICRFLSDNSKIIAAYIENSRLYKFRIWHSELQRIQIIEQSFVSQVNCQFMLHSPVHIVMDNSEFGHLKFKNSVSPEFTTYNISNCKVNRLTLDNFCNYGTIFFSNLKPLASFKDFKKDKNDNPVLRKDKFQFETITGASILRLSDSDLGKLQFINCNLQTFGAFEFSNTKMLDVFVAGSQMPDEKSFFLPDNNQNPLKIAEQKRLAYGQFKKIYETRGDIAGSLPYLAYEMKAYREELRLQSKSRFSFFGEKLMLDLNQMSTNFGNDWWRGFWVTISVTILCFTAYCWALGFRFGPSWSAFWDLASCAPEYLNPLRGADSVIPKEYLKNAGILTQDISGEDILLPRSARVIDYLSRIIVAYFVYQTIQAFRKLGKSSG